MSENDESPPVADDDFPEFAAPPQHRPAPESAEAERRPQPDSAQEGVDEVLARLRRERAEGQR